MHAGSAVSKKKAASEAPIVFQAHGEAYCSAEGLTFDATAYAALVGPGT
jgi:hypothetical protein